MAILRQMSRFTADRTFPRIERGNPVLPPILGGNELRCGGQNTQNLRFVVWSEGMSGNGVCLSGWNRRFLGFLGFLGLPLAFEGTNVLVGAIAHVLAEFPTNHAERTQNGSRGRVFGEFNDGFKIRFDRIRRGGRNNRRRMNGWFVRMIDGIRLMIPGSFIGIRLVDGRFVALLLRILQLFFRILFEFARFFRFGRKSENRFEGSSCRLDGGFFGSF